MAGREEAHRAGVQELRPLAADGQLVARDEARVTCVEPTIAPALDATIRLHDQDVVIAVDGDVGGADLNCVDHSRTSCDRSASPATRFPRQFASATLRAPWPSSSRSRSTPSRSTSRWCSYRGSTSTAS